MVQRSLPDGPFEAAQPLQSASHEPLYEQLAHRLAGAISSGRLAAGQQLPTETALMIAYGVSRITVRQALQLLVRNGQVVTRRGKGSFVARQALQQDLTNLQGFQEALRIQGIEPVTELLEFSTAAGRLDEQLPVGLDLPVRLRRRYCVDGEPFAIVEGFLPAACAQLGEARVRQLAVYDIVQQFLGLRIGRADVAIQCARPSAKVARELELAAGSQVLLMRRTSYTVAGQACEHMRISIVPERYTFRMSVPGPVELARGVHPTTASERSASRTPRASRVPSTTRATRTP